MTSREQRRAWILTKLLVGELTVSEVAALMAVSERHVWRLRRGFERGGDSYKLGIVASGGAQSMRWQ